MDAGFWTVLAKLGWEPAAIGGLLLLLFLFVRAVLTGRLVPRSTVDDLRQDRKDRLEELAKERDLWRQAHETSEGTRQIMAEQLEKLIAQGIVTNELINSLRLEAQK